MAETKELPSEKSPDSEQPEQPSESEQPTQPENPAQQEKSEQKDKSALLEKPAQPEQPAEPEQLEQPDPPAKPEKLAEQEQLEKPSETKEATKAKKSSEAEQEAKPEKVSEPEQAAKPEKVSEPEKVAKPEKPSEAEEATKAEKPSEPEQVAKPEKPSEAEQVAKPEKPSEAEQVAKPEKPSEVEQVAKPEKPSEPEQVAKPKEPLEPKQVVQPEQPAQPEKPSEPEKVAQAEKPSESEESAQPEQKDEPVEPEKLSEAEKENLEREKHLIVSEDGTLQDKKLEIVLAKYWQKDRVVIVGATCEPASAKGTNFTSDVWRIHLSYTENESAQLKSDVVVVKTRPKCSEINKLMHTKTAFANEIFAYEYVLPVLSNVIGVPLRVPKFMHGNEYSIVLEDMHKKSFKSINKKLAVEWNQVWSPITEMAKLHAASIVMKKLDPEKFDALINSIIRTPASETAPLGERQNNALDTILKVLDDAKIPELAKQMEMLEISRKDSWVQQKRVIEEEVPIRVINHGSIWVNNLLYRKDMVTCLDWQHIEYSSPALDLSFFLYVNLDIDFLSNKKQKLIEFYLVNLHQFIYDAVANKLTGPEIKELLLPLTYDWINSELKRFSHYAYMMAQWITPVFYWSEAVYQTVSNQGGIENMSMDQRMKHMTSDQRDRMIKLTKFYAKESSQ